ncbi:MAG: cytochrome c [Longimicrobiales bacterium]|nr:cytochrome c [Longimicrobiales bacterium]
MTTRTRRTSLHRLATLLVLGTLAACGGDAGDNGAVADRASGGAGSSGADAALSAVELEQGIGPIRDLDLGAIDAALAAEGETAFATKCSACHKLDGRYVGPRLGTVLDRRRPEYVMNMMLNADEMVKRHPVVRELLAQFYTPMPVQVTDPDEARAILEYLRSARIDSIADPSGNQP